MRLSQEPTKVRTVQKASSRGRLRAAVVALAVIGFFLFLRLAAEGVIDIDRWFGPCGFKQRYALPCPTCGMTASALAFVRGDIIESFYVQPAAALLCVMLGVTAFFAFLTAVSGLYFGFLKFIVTGVKITHLILFLGTIIGAGWAVTLIRAAMRM